MPTVANASLLDSKSVVWFLRSIGDMYPLECTSSRPFRVQNDYPTGVPSYLDSVKDIPGLRPRVAVLYSNSDFKARSPRTWKSNLFPVCLSPQPARIQRQSLSKYDQPCFIFLTVAMSISRAISVHVRTRPIFRRACSCSSVANTLPQLVEL